MSVFEDLARELEQDPAKCEALRALLLSKELLALPATVAALVAEVAELAKSMREALLRLDHLEADVATLKSDVGSLKGSDLERRWERNLPSYLGSHFRRLRVLGSAQLSDLLEDGIEAGLVLPGEADDARLADVIGRGRRSDGTEVYLVVEVSVVVDRNDIERARRRSGILARATGSICVGVGAGERATEGAAGAADEHGVMLVVVDQEAA
ncbi:MAG: hypothetical protein ACRDX8_05285 [Acidimicrobiales bacterium]